MIDRVSLRACVFATAAVMFGAGHAGATDCMPAASLTAMQELKAAKWQRAGNPAADAEALLLVRCLHDPNPAVRDGLAFEGLQAFMRSGRVEPATLRTLRTRLLGELTAPDPQGFRRPFAVLVLAEVARVDRMKPYLTEPERDQIVREGARYLTNVRDYRGYDEREGWRHGVAHAADLMLQLSLNPQLTQPQGEVMLAAIAAQVVPAGDEFYRYGESDRLAAPTFYLARRWTKPAEWEAWLLQLAAKAPQGGAITQSKLAARHNVNAFLRALYVTVREVANRDLEETLTPGLKKALRAAG